MVRGCKYPKARLPTDGPVRASLYAGGDYATTQPSRTIVSRGSRPRSAQNSTSLSVRRGTPLRGPDDLRICMGLKPRLDQTDRRLDARRRSWPRARGTTSWRAPQRHRDFSLRG